MGFIGSFGRALVGGVKGFVRGGPVGAVTGAVTAAVRPSQNLPMIAPTFRPPSTGGSPLSVMVSMGRQLVGGTQLPDVPRDFPGAVPQPGFRGALERFLPGGQSGFQGAPPGYHVNKRYLAFYRAQQMGKQVQDPTKADQVVNIIVRNRKMNPLNPRALMRANARQVAAVRIMRRTLRGTGYQITRHSFGRKKGKR